MNFNSKRSVTDEQNERHKRLLASILKEEGNKSCADCKTRNPTWASVNLGVFVCLTCSGIHRSLGVHISQVRSCNLDTWLPKQVEFCRVMGNTKGNRYWEARIPKDFRRPPSGNPNPELASFIRAKYVDRAFAAKDAEPPTIDNYLDHPYSTSEEPTPAPTAAPAPTPAAEVTGPSLGLRITPTKAPTPPPLPPPAPPPTVDLLGSFDDFVAAPTPAPPSPALVQASAANDFFSAFVSAPPPVLAAATTTTATRKRTSLEWTDFHAATPPSPSSTAATQPPSNQRLLSPQPSGGHQRSYSASEGLTSASSPGGAVSQPSRFGHTKTLSATQPQLEPQPHQSYRPGHHSRTGSASGHLHGHPDFHQQHSHHSNHHHQNHKQGSANSASDPFGDDLLAGLTIHHVMESMSTMSAGSDAGAAVLSGTFPISSSSTPGDHLPPSRGSGHKRHPSNAKSTEEVLRLFDTEPSTGTGGSGGGGGAVSSAPPATASDDPFGDFLGAAPPSQDTGFNRGAVSQQHPHMTLFAGHSRSYGVSNGVASGNEAFNLL